MSNEMQLVVDDQPERALPAIKPEMQVAVSSNPYDNMLVEAVRGGNIDIIERLMALKERDEANTARKAFTAAKAAFKGEAVVVVKDKFNTQFKSMYSSLGNLVGTVSPFLSKHGLSADWTLEQSNGQITVTCVLSHALGYSESVPFTVPPDTSGGGAKNPIQAIKSAVTYAKAVTYESVCGMASTDANHDDDGNGTTPEKEVKQHPKEKIVGPRFDQALQAIRNEQYTPEQMRGYYALTPDQETALADLERELKK